MGRIEYRDDKEWQKGLVIAYAAYKEIKFAIDKVERDGICANWDEFISVGQFGYDAQDFDYYEMTLSI